MLLILHKVGSKRQAGTIADNLRKVYGQSLSVKTRSVDRIQLWPGERAWDYLMIVLYGSDRLPANAKSVIECYQRDLENGAFVLPVCLSRAPRKPPQPESTKYPFHGPLRWKGDTQGP